MGLKIDIENKLDSITQLYDAWQLLENAREFCSTNATNFIDAAQAEIDKAIISTTQDVVAFRRMQDETDD